jgi:transposase-like protein
VPKSYPPEFRRKVIDLVESGRPVAQVAVDLGISEQTIYVWRRQHLIDTGWLPGTTTAENAELAATRKRIVELETELAIHRRASELLGKVVAQKQVRGHQGDGRRRHAGAGRDPCAGCL